MNSKEVQKLDLVVIADSDDISFRFIIPDLFDELVCPDGMKYHDYVNLVWDILGKAIEEKDPRIVKYELAQAFRQDAVVDMPLHLGRILTLVN